MQQNTAVPPPALLSDLALLDQSTNSTKEAIASVVLPTNTVNPIYVILQGSICGAGYLIVVVCSLAIYLHLRRAYANSGQAGVVYTAGRVQARQINAILMVNAAVPFAFDFLPTYAATALIHLGGAQLSPQSPAVVLMCLVWAPVVNASSIILVVGPYRRAVMGRRDWSENPHTGVGTNHTNAVAVSCRLPDRSVL